ncbi:MAG TPA: polysaccharide pyruvyl transferase family protein [Chitinispirillaceae bacterium]|jgi:polysaccharide pyruvyl transferase WcaK-like protein|nr:polysaccharide pyruvyl transferase family protein [Chitinispirillaceae bacterium]
MKFFCPRVLNGNRGDIASRLGVLLTFRKEGILDIVVSCRRKEEIFPSGYTAVPCGKLYNFLPSRAGLRALLDCDAILWTCGLDLQDDSSLLKLLHTFLLFLYYRILGKKIYVLNQGAGPINRKSGVFLTRLILSLTDLFITRDSRTHNLLSSINPKVKLLHGYDAIFTSSFSEVLGSDRALYKKDISGQRSPLIGFNIRRWYHFSSSLLPYKYARKSYESRGVADMEKIVSAGITFCSRMVKEHNARILLFSMYEAGIDPWESEEKYLIKIRDIVGEGIEFFDTSATLQEFCTGISSCDIMVGMRLHSTLLALRCGVPAINLSYTHKGRDIFSDLGFGDWVIDLDTFKDCPEELVVKVQSLLQEKQEMDNIQSIISRNDAVIKKCIMEILKT